MSYFNPEPLLVINTRAKDNLDRGKETLVRGPGGRIITVAELERLNKESRIEGLD